MIRRGLGAVCMAVFRSGRQMENLNGSIIRSDLSEVVTGSRVNV